MLNADYQNCLTNSNSQLHKNFTYIYIYMYMLIRNNKLGKLSNQNFSNYTYIYYGFTLVEMLTKMVIFLLPVLVNVAFVTLLERKILGFSQIRLGPTKVGFKGVLQPFSDAVKLFVKQFEINSNSNSILFFISPVIMFSVIFLLWLVVPSWHNHSCFKIGIIVFIILLRIGVYPLLLSGWSSNSKYAIIGSLRGVAQTISYEISLALVIIALAIILLRVNFTSLGDGSVGIILMTPMVFVLWFVMMIAETNRTPFDFSEGESELVSGFNIEYASVGFVLIFLAEYASILLFSSLAATLFIGVGIFGIRSAIFSVLVTSVWIVLRATFPRYRYDMLINIAWKRYLPQRLSILILVRGAMTIFYFMNNNSVFFVIDCSGKGN